MSSSSRKSGCLRVPFFEFPEKVGVFEFLFEFRLSSSFLKVGVFEFLPKSGCLRVPSLKVGVFEFLPSSVRKVGVFEFRLVSSSSVFEFRSSSVFRKSGCLRVPRVPFSEKVGVFEFRKSGCLRVPFLRVPFLWLRPLINHELRHITAVFATAKR